MDKIKLSVVIPVYNEQENIKDVYYQTRVALSALNLPFEIIFVDDGSNDRTYLILRNIQAQDVNVMIIKFAKNYGQLFAFLASFEFSKGEIVITMDGDLQYDPYDIPKFLEKIKEGYDLVSGWRFDRKDPLSRKLISKISNQLIKIKTGVALHDYGCAFTAIKKELVDKLKDYGRNARFIKPLLVRLADSAAEVKVRHHFRERGSSKYNFGKIIKVGLDFFFNFTTAQKKENITFYSIKEIISSKK